jgi:hypothetical protein
MLTSILTAYGFSEDQCDIVPFGTGLINHTWKITTRNEEYILQRINQNVFKNPPAIAENIRIISDYLKTHAPGYLFVTPVPTIHNEDLVYENEGYYRLMPFIRNSRTYAVVSTPDVACEAAREFGCFTRKLSGFDSKRLHITLQDFHNLTLRYRQFELSLQQGNKDRIRQSREEAEFLTAHKHLVDVYEQIITDPNFKKRVTHHDTKISNVLFDAHDHGICVIDLDTTMSGYFISDVGDMMRTYLCPLSEEENDFANLRVRDEYFSAIANGYLGEMKDELSQSELDHFVYAGEFMIYMQAVRFLTDYFNNDVYYGSKYEGHNFVRAKNQIVLLERYMEKSNQFKNQVSMLAGTPINN